MILSLSAGPPRSFFFPPPPPQNFWQVPGASMLPTKCPCGVALGTLHAVPWAGMTQARLCPGAKTLLEKQKGIWGSWDLGGLLRGWGSPACPHPASHPPQLRGELSRPAEHPKELRLWEAPTLSLKNSSGASAQLPAHPWGRAGITRPPLHGTQRALSPLSVPSHPDPQAGVPKSGNVPWKGLRRSGSHAGGDAQVRVLKAGQGSSRQRWGPHIKAGVCMEKRGSHGQVGSP